jgi:hypothetical protein
MAYTSSAVWRGAKLPFRGDELLDELDELRLSSQATEQLIDRLVVRGYLERVLGWRNESAAVPVIFLRLQGDIAMRAYAAIGFLSFWCMAATPAFAEWDHLGTVTFSTENDQHSTNANFFGDRVALTSRLGNVYCRNVTVTLGSGKVRAIFHGMLRSGYTENVALPADSRDVRQLDLDCHPMNGTPATVDIAANTPSGDFGEQRYG